MHCAKFERPFTVWCGRGGMNLMIVCVMAIIAGESYHLKYLTS